MINITICYKSPSPNYNWEYKHMTRTFRPILLFLILFVIILFLLAFGVFVLDEQPDKMLLYFCVIILFLGDVFVPTRYLRFTENRIETNINVITLVSKYKTGVFKRIVIEYDMINRVDYSDIKTKYAKHCLVNIELKDNNQLIILQIQGFNKWQRIRINNLLEDIFIYNKEKQ